MATSAEALASSTSDVHESLAPAVHTHHAHRIVADIQALRFPSDAFTNPQDVANEVLGALAYTPEQAEETAKQDGMLEILHSGGGLSMVSYGYADRPFTTQVAGTVGKEIGHFLRQNGVIEAPLSLMDYANMFQTGWFGDIANQTALTGRGILQRYIEDNGSFEPGQLFQRAFDLDASKETFALEAEPNNGLLSVNLTRDAKVAIRSRLGQGRGCPVARQSFMASPEQVTFLEANDHLGEASGFYPEEQLTTSGLIKVSQGVYTAIDDVLWHWGDYIHRYARHLLAKGENPHGIRSTAANEVLLLTVQGNDVELPIEFDPSKVDTGYYLAA